jgi:hypothetical protein
MARNTTPSIATEGWHPQQFFAIQPAELLREYADYRAVTLEHLAADGRCRATYRPDQTQRVFDLVHLKYLAPMLSPAVMDYLIRQSMLPDTTSRQIIAGIWSTFTRPSDGRAGGLKHYLAGAVALLDQAYGAVQHLHRFAGLYAELRFQGKLDVSFRAQQNDGQA